VNKVELTDKEHTALLRWAGVDLTKCLELNSKPCPLQIAGSNRNVIRAAERWGQKLVAMLAASGELEPDESPDAALERILTR